MKKFICLKCGVQSDNPKIKDRGTAGCLVMGLLFLITLPTVIIPIIIVIVDYVWYKSSVKDRCCPYCGSEGCMIPTNSVLGRNLVETYYEIQK